METRLFCRSMSGENCKSGICQKLFQREHRSGYFHRIIQQSASSLPSYNQLKCSRKCAAILKKIYFCFWFLFLEMYYFLLYTSRCNSCIASHVRANSSTVLFAIVSAVVLFKCFTPAVFMRKKTTQTCLIHLIPEFMVFCKPSERNEYNNK